MTDWVYIFGIVFVILGLVLIVFEVIHPGAFMLIPGTVFLVAGLLFLFFPSVVTETIWGAVILVVVAVVVGIATIPLYQWMAPGHRPMSTTPSSITGETGLVTAPVVPDSTKGKVQVRGEVWSARSRTPIPAGTRVKVVGGEGVCIWVEPDLAPSAPAAPVSAVKG